MSDVQGNRAHDATDRGAPIKIGGKAETTTPTAVADGDRVDAFFDEYGRLVVREEYPGAWRETSAATVSGGLSVSHAASSGNVHRVTGLQCSGDAAALVTVESPDTTVIWRKRTTAAFAFSEVFPIPLQGGSGGAILLKISASTNSEANFQGYTTVG